MPSAYPSWRRFLSTHPSDAGRWTRLLEDYEPSVVHAWQLRTALSYLGQSDAISANGSNGDGFSVAVLSLSSDRGALALGPQLAVFAASLGIPTALVIGPQQDAERYGGAARRVRRPAAVVKAIEAAAGRRRRSQTTWPGNPGQADRHRRRRRRPGPERC